MFNCEICHKTSKPNEPQHKIVTLYRDTNYVTGYKELANGTKVPSRFSKGTEIAEEIAVCESCYNKTKK